MNSEILSGGRKDLLIALVLLALAIGLPFLIDSRYVLGQVILALFYACIATQWNLVFGFAGIFSLAPIAIFAVGGYATAMLCYFLGWSVWAALIPAALAASVFSVLIGLACLRLTGVYVALLTLAVAHVMSLLSVTDTECFIQVQTVCRQLTGGPGGFSRFGDFGMRNLLRGSWMIGNYAIVCTLFAIVMGVTWVIVKSPVGLAFRAVRDNSGYAVARGINRFRIQLLVFGVSAFLIGLSGGVYAAHFQVIGPTILQLPQLMFIIAIVLIGGVGTFWGPLLGTVVLMGADELMREAGEFRTLGLGIIIVVAIVLMPKGLVGRFEQLFHYRTRGRAGQSDSDLGLGSQVAGFPGEKT